MSTQGKRYQKSFEVQPENTSLLVAEAFGVGPGWVNHIVDVCLPESLPAITLITGESGCGKSTLLKMLGSLTPFAAPKTPLHKWAASDEDALRLLNSVGLNDASLFVLHYPQLSDSQQARARMYFWLCQKIKHILVDEFLSTLDRKTAMALAFSFQRMLRREGITLIAATAHDDLGEYLKPDLIIRGTAFPSDWKIEFSKMPTSNPFQAVEVRQEKEISTRGTPGAACENFLTNGTVCGRNLCKEPFCTCGKNRKPRMSPGKDAYQQSRLGEIHYKGKYAGGVQEYISARWEGRIIGWLVGAQQRTGSFRIARVVVHPTYRGCGIGQKLIRFYLGLRPDCDTVAAMARFNPVFERAGMKRVADITVKLPSFLKRLPLSRLEWASAECCQRLMKTDAKSLAIVTAHADALGRDTHPGGKTPPEGLATHFRNHPDAAGQAIWRARPRQMAKYVGPTHPLFGGTSDAK